jgi:hypothetical protein
MYVSESKLSEGISPIVYHYTRARTARNILSTGEFQLSSTLGSVEEPYTPKGYPYFLSTTRTRRGGYHDIVGSDAVLFVLDGTWYSRHYKGAPIDYWLNRDPLQSHHKSHEAEDRIFSKDPTMSAKGVTAIHLYVSSEAEPQTRAWARQALILAKRAGIPAYFYTDKDAWRNQDTRKMGDVSVLKGQDTTRGYVSSHKGYLIPWIELVNAKDKSQLSKKADSLRYSLQYSYDKDSAAQGLANDLSNARKPDSGPDREHAVNIIKYMQANKLNTVKDLVNNLTDKWKSVEKVTEAVTDNYLYHSIESMDTFRKIINTREIKPNNPIEYEENDIELPVISASRNQYYRFPYGGGNIQFVIDKDVLKKAGFKVKPYSYAQHYVKGNAENTLHKQETEEQIFPVKGHGIPVKQPYIVGIQINPEFKDTPELEEIQKLAKSVNIPVSFMKTAVKPVAKKVDIKLTPKFDPNRFVISPATGDTKQYFPMMMYDKETGVRWGLDADYTNAQINDRLKNVTEASGYIPSEKQKRDPRFKTALTVDVHPDSIQKNAKAFKSKISRAGIPPIANPNGKF